MRERRLRRDLCFSFKNSFEKVKIFPSKIGEITVLEKCQKGSNY